LLRNCANAMGRHTTTDASGCGSSNSPDQISARHIKRDALQRR
jgi:hypothetical protein